MNDQTVSNQENQQTNNRNDDKRIHSANDFLQQINEAYANTNYPSAFTSSYTIMECLGERNGIDTFLVQNTRGTSYVAKCYDKSVYAPDITQDLLHGLDHPGLPGYVDSFENDRMIISLREYIDGTPLDRYIIEHTLSEQEIISVCIRICDILSYLHHQPEPIIHRDIKPQNIIVRPDLSVVLIDFDIARIYHQDNDTDTRFFGTIAYAPPEQYGFSQTDSRTDIYSLGILLRYLLTGSTRENPNIKIYRPLHKIIRKATGFSPKERYSDVDQMKQALRHANPGFQFIRTAGMIICIIAGVGLLTFGGIKLYQAATYTPFSEDAIPAFLSDEERIADASNYMRNTYHTEMFDNTDDIATIGTLRTVMIDLYGLDPDYVYGINTEMPQENEEYFLPWGWDDGQTVDRDIMIYAAIKVHDPSIVADWSSIKDDNGYYPGVRVAVAFADKTGIATGANRPGDISIGEMALILANTDRVFASADSTVSEP